MTTCYASPGCKTHSLASLETPVSTSIDVQAGEKFELRQQQVLRGDFASDSPCSSISSQRGVKFSGYGAMSADEDNDSCCVQIPDKHSVSTHTCTSKSLVLTRAASLGLPSDLDSSLGGVPATHSSAQSVPSHIHEPKAAAQAQHNSQLAKHETPAACDAHGFAGSQAYNSLTSIDALGAGSSMQYSSAFLGTQRRAGDPNQPASASQQLASPSDLMNNTCSVREVRQVWPSYQLNFRKTEEHTANKSR